jgi:thiamine-monophosphate kinase
MPEFDLISRLQEIICIAPDAGVAGCRVGIGDDAAVLDVSGPHELVVCVDTLVAGVHFPEDTPPAAIGHKALAVNLSDLAAMGAEPAWFFLAVTLPSGDMDWLEAFAGGMANLASQAQIALAGGDMSSGPLSITVTAIGRVERGSALLRSGARAGDLVVVSGTLGAAAHALNNLRSGEVPQASDLKALEFPEPRVALGLGLRGLATSCIDVSDGLMADMGHILRQSGVGADIELEKLPCPASLENTSRRERWPIQLAGGDDYELCFTVPPDSGNRLAEIALARGVDLTMIGVVTDHEGLVLWTGDGRTYDPDFQGYQHFDGRQEGSV